MFTHKGYTFDVGYVYVGNNEVFKKALTLGLSKPVQFNQFNEFDMVKLGKDKGFLLQAPLN